MRSHGNGNQGKTSISDPLFILPFRLGDTNLGTDTGTSGFPPVPVSKDRHKRPLTTNITTGTLGNSGLLGSGTRNEEPSVLHSDPTSLDQAPQLAIHVTARVSFQFLGLPAKWALPSSARDLYVFANKPLDRG